MIPKVGIALAASALAVAGILCAGGAARRPSARIDRGSIAGVRIGDSLRQATGLWGAPGLITREPSGEKVAMWARTRTSRYPVRYATLYLRRGTVVGIEVYLPGSNLRTSRGDGAGTRPAIFLRHWPNAHRVQQLCCSPGFFYTLAAVAPGYVLAFHFPEGHGLENVLLVSAHEFQACYVGECS